VATIEDLVQLFSALAENDSAGAKSVALTIASKEGKRGHYNAEQTLKGALLTHSSSPQKAQSLSSESSIIKALTQVESKLDLDEIELPSAVREDLMSVVEEYLARWNLKRAGVPIRNRLLFVGPPGCGKSVTAAALGRRLNLPVFVLRFDSLIGSYLGQTAQNLRAVFDFIQTNPCILLIDEIDAISSARGRSRDIAELDRVVISLMQQLELVTPAGLLICTSNLPETIDAAVIRRFDASLKFPKPSAKNLVAYCSKLIERYGVNVPRKNISAASKLSSYADVERLIIGEVRNKILDEFRRGRA